MKVRYRGDATDAQVQWGSNDDPRSLLIVGHVYETSSIEEHSWHTKYRLVGVEGEFNSVHFDEVP